MEWPTSVMVAERIEQLRPEGEDTVLAYFYQSICDAAASDQKAAEVAKLIQSTIHTMPETGVLGQGLVELGTNGAQQVANLVKAALMMSGQQGRSGSAIMSHD